MHRGVFTNLSTRTLCATAAQARHASTTSAAAPSPRPPFPPKSTKSSREPPSSRPPRTPKFRKQMQEEKVVARILDKMVKAKERPGKSWTYMPSRRGEEMRLKQQVKEAGQKMKPSDGSSSKPTGSVSFSKSNAVVAAATLQSSSSQVFGSPVVAEQVEREEEVGFIPETPLGSFVEMRRNDIAELGVIVGSGFLDRQWKLSVLTKDGESWVSIKEDVFFSIPSICPADLAARCGLQPIAESDTQLNARVEVLKRLRELERQVENAMIAISRQLGSIYETIRAKDPNEWAEVTVTEVAKIFHRTPTAVEIFATHRLLMENSTRFVASLSYQTDQTFRVRPLKDVEDLLQVQEWVRKRHPLLEDFLKKAMKVREVQKKLMEKTSTERPALERAEHQWTESDKTIIRFMTAALRHGRAIQADPYTVGTGHITKRVYGSGVMAHVDDDVHQFLVDIGVFTPWQDLILIDPSNKLDLETRPAVLNEREQSILRALEKSESNVPTHPDDFYASDPMVSVRRDWGDMPVYVVDDTSAEELDDGLSFERIPSEPDNLWIHVHVADPASVIPPTNFLAQKAAQQSETWYMVPKSFPLFPKCIIHHPTHGLSLGMRSSSGLPDRVMTFSAKVDSEGNILDQGVQAGLIRNVKVINYDAVDAALGNAFMVPEYPFGGRPPPPTVAPLAPEIIEDMKVLNKAAAAQRRQRLSKDWVAFERMQALIERRPGEFPVDMDGRVDTTHLHRGFPNLSYTVELMSRNSEYGARAIIAEMMKLASRAASRFCTEKNIPVLRRTANPMVPVSEEAIQTILEMKNESGYVKEEDVLQHIIYTPGAQYKTHPGMHYGLGVPEGEGYVRVTSPLRRYGDLVAHWQIQHALLEGKPKFGLDWMEDFAVTLAMKDQYVKGTLRRHSRFWALLHIKRWQELFAGGRNEHLWPRGADGKLIDDPLGNLEGYMLTLPVLNRLTSSWQVVLRLPRLGLKEIVGGIPKDLVGAAYLGMRVPVKIQSIHLGIKPLMMLEYDKSRKAW